MVVLARFLEDGLLRQVWLAMFGLIPAIDGVRLSPQHQQYHAQILFLAIGLLKP